MPLRQTLVTGLALFGCVAVAFASGRRAEPTPGSAPSPDRLSRWTVSAGDGKLTYRLEAASDKGVDTRMVLVLIMKDSRIGHLGDPQMLVVEGGVRRGVFTTALPIPEPDKTRAVRVTLFERPWQGQGPFRPVDELLFEMRDVRARDTATRPAGKEG